MDAVENIGAYFRDAIDDICFVIGRKWVTDARYVPVKLRIERTIITIERYKYTTRFVFYGRLRSNNIPPIESTAKVRGRLIFRR